MGIRDDMAFSSFGHIRWLAKSRVWGAWSSFHLKAEPMDGLCTYNEFPKRHHAQLWLWDRYQRWKLADALTRLAV